MTFKFSANPKEAESDWENFLKAYQSFKGKSFISKPNPAFLKLFGNSRFLTRFIINKPHYVDKILKSPYLKKEKDFNTMERDCKQWTGLNPKDGLNLLRDYKYCELFRITMKDFADVSQEVILRELSHLAYVLLRQVDHHLYQESVAKWGKPVLSSGKECQYHILALGKLGGMELNYSSDIDLIAMIESDEGKAGHLSLHEFFVHHVQSLTQALQDKTEHGFLYRVDWDLRPEGKAGTLVNSIQALLTYYENFGADWERQALTKASLGCGSDELGNQFLSSITPFVYRKYFDLQSIARVCEMRERIHDSLIKKSDKGFNVKLGLGGIREIEFFSQAFLLIYGGRFPEIRSTGTLNVLENLRFKRLINARDAKTLTEGYYFLRKLEHRLQLVDEAQTHVVAHDPTEQLKVARRMGYESHSHFMADLARVTVQIHQLFENLFTERTEFPLEEKNPVSLLSDALRTGLSKEPGFEQKLDFIRIFKKEEMKKIEVLETNPSITRQEILLKLSILAEAILNGALQLAISELQSVYGDPAFQSQLILLAMGKLGGFEINYESDLDMIFVFSENGETSGPKKITNSEYFARLVQKLIMILSVPTRHGFAYAIDAELRPSGHAGPLVTSLERFLDYQREASQIWERQALLRARPIAGSPYLSRLMREHLNALLYFSPFPPDIRHEMHRLRLRVEKEVAKETAKSIDLKLGKGAMMDVEFILQYLQLCNSYQHERLRTHNTFEGLNQVIQLNLLGDSDQAVLLKEAYTFYRTLESKLSLHLKRSFKKISVETPLLNDVGKEMGFENGKKLLAQYVVYRDKVRAVYWRLFTS